MKIQTQHYAELKEMLTPLAEKIKPHREYLIKEGKCEDVEKRLRWDITYARRETSAYISSTLYPYMNDDHLDTALRHIVAELEATQ